MNSDERIVLGVIPARGGSKGIPGKNIKLINGKPLIAHAIECGIKCNLIEHLIVSTDSTEIAEVAKHWGAEVPFIRPGKLAEDTTPMLPVLQHVIIEAENYYGKLVKNLILLDPTAPFRTVQDIKDGYALFNNSDCEALISCNIAHRNPYFNMVKKKGDYIELVNHSTIEVGRRQDAPEVYDINTVLWIWSRRAIMEEQARIPKRTIMYLTPPERSIDLDTEFDFLVAEMLLRQQFRASL